MSRSIFEIDGFEQWRKKVKSLPDKVKKREVVKILRQSAKSTLTAARLESPVSKRENKTTPKENLKKSIKTRTLRRAKQPMVVVGPGSSGKNDGWYGRQFVIPGHKTTGGSKVSANPFTERAQNKTKGKVETDSVAKVTRYLQKQIDRL